MLFHRAGGIKLLFVFSKTDAKWDKSNKKKDLTMMAKSLILMER
jgi:hypothetical protein